MTPEQAIDVLPALAGARVSRQLADGPASTTWMLQRGADELVLSIDKPLAAELGLDREAEYALLEQLAPRGLGLAPVAVAAAKGLLVVRAMAGRPLDPAELGDPSTLERLGQLLGRLHQVVVRAPRLDLAAVVGRYAALGRDTGKARLAKSAKALLRTLPRSGTICLCHNDIHAGNILRRSDGQLGLIDWEYAGSGDPLFELAVLAEETRLTRAALAELLQAYLEAGGQAGVTAARVAEWRLLYAQIRTLWEGAGDQR